MTAIEDTHAPWDHKLFIYFKSLAEFRCFEDALQPRTQDLSLGKTLAAAGHVPRPKFSPRGCGESIKLHASSRILHVCL
jgi:hypothetical protein